MDQNENHSPLNQLPWIVWALALPVIAMELVLGLADIGLVGGPFWQRLAYRCFAALCIFARFNARNVASGSVSDHRNDPTLKLLCRA